MTHKDNVTVLGFNIPKSEFDEQYQRTIKEEAKALIDSLDNFFILSFDPRMNGRTISFNTFQDSQAVFYLMDKYKHEFFESLPDLRDKQ